MFKMKSSTKIGWALVTIALIFGAFLIAGQSSYADSARDKGLVIKDEGKRLVKYEGDAKRVSVPVGVETIEKKAFAGTSVERVDLASTVKSMGSGVFSDCKDLESVTLGSVEAIPADTFSGCESLSSVSIPSSVKEVGSNAFSGCKALGSISLPGAITAIDYETAFSDCKKLNALSISGNSFYSTEDGNLFNASGTRLLKVPEGKKAVSLKKGITTIGSGSFSGNQKVKSVVLPRTVDTVEDEAFGHSGVRIISIPKEISQFGTQSKWKPETVYGYSGTDAAKVAKNTGAEFVDLKGQSELDETYDTGEDDEDVDARMYPDDPEDSDDPDDPDSTEDPDNPDDPDDPDDPAYEEEDDYSGGDAAGYDDEDDEEYYDTSDDSSSSGSSSSTKKSQTATSTRRTGGTTVRTASRSKDTTPKTADINIDPRYLLCLVILLAGVYVILSSRWRGIRIIKKGWEKEKEEEE